jgi:hypothetical protein
MPRCAGDAHRLQLPGQAQPVLSSAPLTPHCTASPGTCSLPAVLLLLVLLRGSPSLVPPGLIELCVRAHARVHVHCCMFLCSSVGAARA